jgi:PAS domain S-box-containing protein
MLETTPLIDLIWAMPALERTLVSRPTVDGVLQAIATLAVEHLGASRVAICDIAEDGSVRRHWWLGDKVPDELGIPSVAEAAIRAIHLDPNAEHPDAEPFALRRGTGTRQASALWIAPVVVDRTVRAAFIIGFTARFKVDGGAPATAKRAAPTLLRQGLRLLAARASAGISAALQSAETQRRLSEHDTLNDVTLAFTSALRGKDLLTFIAKSALRLTLAESCALFVLNDGVLECVTRMLAQASDEVVEVEGVGPGEAVLAERVRHQNGQTLARADGKALSSAEIASGMRAVLLGLPIRYEHELLGVLCIGGPAGGEFTASQAAALWVLCSHAAIALENSRLVEEERRRAQQASALVETASASGTTTDLDEVLNMIVATTARLTGADRSSILLLDEHGAILRPAALFNMDEHFVRLWRQGQLRLDEELLSKEAIATGQPVVVRDARQDSRTNKEAVAMFDDKSILVVPMQARGEIIGTLWVNHVRAHYDFTDDDIQTTAAIARQATMAISNARLYQQLQRKSEQLVQRRLAEVSTVLGVSTEIASILHIDAMLQSVVDNVRTVMDVDSCRLYRVTQAQGSRLPDLQLATESHGTHQPEGDSPILHLLARKCLASRSPVVIARADAAGDLPYQGIICAPMVARDHHLGALCVYTRRPHDFLQDEQQLLMAFANQAAVAIEHADLFESLRRRVRELSGLHELSKTMQTLPVLERTLGSLSDKLGELLDVEHCVILLHDERTNEMVAQKPGHGLTDEQIERLRIRFEDGMATTYVWRTGETYLSNDAHEDDGHVKRWVEQFDERSLLLVPMRTGDRTLGIIRAANKRRGQFTDDDVQLLTIFASQATAIVQQAMLYYRVDRERAELDAILENSSDSIFVFTLEGMLGRMNRAAETLFGSPLAELADTSCRHIFNCNAVGPNSSCADGCVIRRVAQSRAALPYLEHTVVAHDGRGIDLTSSYTYVEGAGGQGDCVVVITRDLSRLKEVERLKSDFVSMVSHELRTPLALIKGFAATMLRLDETLEVSTRKRFLHNIDDASDRLTRLIDNLLNVSRIEAGRFKINPKAVDVNDLVRRTAASMGTQAQGHVIETRLTETSCVVWADKDQIEQVLLNLLVNALKYSVEHGVIRVAVREDGDWIEVTVADQGVGIAEDELPHLFGKFHRGDDAATKRASGSGLGLYICKSIIDAHQGRIWVNSVPGHGSTFGFALKRRG